MREDFLHFVWKTQKIQNVGLTTSLNEDVKVLNTGQHNKSSGPDFFNARVCIANQEWAGNVEIHLKSSDWYAHGHEKDANYDNVILHVVWDDDLVVYRKDGSMIPTLPLKSHISPNLLGSYQRLLDNRKKKFINCEKDSSTIDTTIWRQWQEQLFVERLEQKSSVIESLTSKTKNNWEVVLFRLLMKTFGLNKNGSAFLAISEHINDSVLRKVCKNTMQMEALFFGLAGFLEDKDVLDEYYLKLKTEFNFLKNKFQLQEYFGEKPIFYGLRPPNFPTIRLSQLANIYGNSTNLFSDLMKAKSIDEIKRLFDASASSYWNTHFTFAKESKRSKKALSKNFVQLVVINAVIPLRFCYDRYLGRNQIDGLVELMNQLSPEKNPIVDGFEKIKVSSVSAFESQAKLQLYNGYCKANRCLQCQIGASLLGRKN